jgi:quercetin dioxygenase-like cupin family protein
MNKQSAAKKIFCLLTAMLVASVAGAGEYPGAHVTSPGQYAVLLENEEVLVLKMVLEPGESDVMHSHHNETVYFQQGGMLTITEPNGEALVAEVPDGHIMWHPAWSHQVTNSGDTTVVAIIVEDKP